MNLSYGAVYLLVNLVQGEGEKSFPLGIPDTGRELIGLGLAKAKGNTLVLTNGVQHHLRQEDRWLYLNAILEVRT